MLSNMSYELPIEMSSSLSSDLVKKIITDSVEEKTGMLVENIIELYDDGKFTGFQVNFQVQKNTGSKTWRPQIWK